MRCRTRDAPRGDCEGGAGAGGARAPQAGRFALTARIAILGDGQQLEFTVNDGKTPVAAALPFAIGLWQQTKPVDLTLAKGRNINTVSLPTDSRGVTAKDFTLNPAK